MYNELIEEQKKQEEETKSTTSNTVIISVSIAEVDIRCTAIYCEGCYKYACNHCITVCHCGEVRCPVCVAKNYKPCESCKDQTCSDCSSQKCEVCTLPSCSAIECSERLCYTIICAGCEVVCSRCKNVICHSHVRVCKTCNPDGSSTILCTSCMDPEKSECSDCTSAEERASDMTSQCVRCFNVCCVCSDKIPGKCGDCRLRCGACEMDVCTKCFKNEKVCETCFDAGQIIAVKRKRRGGLMD